MANAVLPLSMPSSRHAARCLSVTHPLNAVCCHPPPSLQLNDGPAPKDDVQHLPKPSWQQAAWPLNDNSQPPRRRNWPLDDDSN